MKYYVDHHPELEASISVDGPGPYRNPVRSLGIQTYEVNFNGIGGHACSMFGKVANPAPCGGQSHCQDLGIPCSADPMTTFAVTNFHAGSFSGAQSMPSISHSPDPL